MKYDFDLLKNMEYNDEDVLMNQQLNALKAFINLYQAAVREIESRFLTLDEEFSTRYQHNPIQHVITRVKDIQSIVSKLVKKNVEVSSESAALNLNDIGGVRVICSYIEDIYTITGLFLKQEDIVLIRKRDYIKHPKRNGYRSLHLVVEVPVYLSSGKEMVRVEIQLRTIAMDFWASLEHDLRYKSVLSSDEGMSKRLFECAKQANQLDLAMQEIYHDSLTNNLLKFVKK